MTRNILVAVLVGGISGFVGAAVLYWPEASPVEPGPTTRPATESDMGFSWAIDDAPMTSVYLQGRVALEIDTGKPLDISEGKIAYRLRFINCRLNYMSSDFGDNVVSNYLLVPK